MHPLFAQARFPAPEFEDYTLPEMNLETVISDPTYLRVVVLAVFLLVSGICFYRVRSRKLLLMISAAGLLVFGYAFNACPCPVGMFQNVVEGVSVEWRETRGEGREENRSPLTTSHSESLTSHLSPLASHPSPLAPSLGILLLFAVPLATALFFGRLFCAGSCPLGAVQELLYWGAPHVPRPLDRVLRMLPVALLLVFTVMTASGMGFTLCYYDLYLPLFLLSFTLPFAAITIAFLLIGLVVSRPFCRYICPYGVLLRFFALFAAIKPQIPFNQRTKRKRVSDTGLPLSLAYASCSDCPSSCINCKLCEQGCPNGAIIPPEPLPPPDVQKHAARRLATLVSLTPFALLLGGILGYIAAPIVNSWHPNVKLLRMLNAGEQTLEVEAFEELGKSRATLENDVVRTQNRIMLGLCLAGILFAGYVMAELIAESRRRKEEDKYCIDASLCFCCGRCYQTCPLEKYLGVSD